MADTQVTTPVEDTSATTATVEAATSKEATSPAKKKKNKRTVASGHVHVQATFNNTIVTFTDPKGNVLTKSSAGACGFRGSKKGTAYAAQVAAEQAGQSAKQQYGFSKAEVFVKGVGLGRDSAVRALGSLEIAVESIKDVTGVPHGGVRPKKARRI
jgi:small subunit ribosomal protein S11